MVRLTGQQFLPLPKREDLLYPLTRSGLSGTFESLRFCFGRMISGYKDYMCEC